MRTPGDDYELVTGFLVTEQIVAGVQDILSLRHCTEAPDPAAVDNIVRVRLKPGVEVDFEKLSRHFFGSSSCGVCGKASIEQLRLALPPLSPGPVIPAARIPEMMRRMEPTQEVFKQTGGLHAAALFGPSGNHLITREDVGRHNAVDKVIGRACRQPTTPLSESVLVLSGRVSFEIVQKALMVGIPMIVAVSAPSSLAIDLAREHGLTLLGFVRGERFNLYCGANVLSAVKKPGALSQPRRRFSRRSRLFVYSLWTTLNPARRILMTSWGALMMWTSFAPLLSGGSRPIRR